MDVLQGNEVDGVMDFVEMILFHKSTTKTSKVHIHDNNVDSLSWYYNNMRIIFSLKDIIII